MKTYKLMFIALFFLSIGNVTAQKAKENLIISAISFDKDKIILNGQVAYKYVLVQNDFTISDLHEKAIIKGTITSQNNKFSSIITFVEQDIKFSNKKIIGRNDLIFALCQDNVIQENFTLNNEKLASFLHKYNQYKN